MAPIHVAAQNNKPDEVRTLLETKVDIHQGDEPFGWTALHVASGHSACDSIRVLLELRASPACKSNDGEVPLHLAATEGHTMAIRLLAQARADVNHGNQDSETPLHVAVQHVGGKPTGHIRELIELGADNTLKDKEGHDAFQMAGLYTNRAKEVINVLNGVPVTTDPEDTWPETLSELETGVDPLVVAQSLRELGNKRFKEGRYEDAFKLYLRAKLFLPKGPSESKQPIDEGDVYDTNARACSIAIYSNAAMCKLKLADYDTVVEMCDAILSLDPANVKALYRKGVALRSTQDVIGAETVFKQALDLDPKDATIQKELADITQQRRKEKDKEKKLAQKMFG